jgi:crossover junction endodeoxyribonuclease RuvC
LNNQKTGIDVAQARWAIVYALAKKWIPILEFTPLQVKSGITGSGNANKKQVQNALKLILKLDAIPRPDDAADALAIAWLTSKRNLLLGKK